VDEQLDGPLALAHDGADLGQLHVLTELQGHGRALLRGEGVDGRPDPRRLVTLGDALVKRGLLVGDAGCGIQVLLGTLAAVVVCDGIDADLIEPGAERMAARLVSVDRPERLEEHLGGDVLGRVLLA